MRFVALPVKANAIGRTYQPGAQIFCQGDPVFGPYKVLSGAVRSCQVLGDGRRQILGFHLVDDIFGLEVGSEHSTSAEAMTTSSVALTRLRPMENPDAAIDLFELATEQLRSVNELNATLGRTQASERIAGFLLELARRFQSTDFDLPMTRTDIADYLALAVETVSRILTELDNDRLISLTPYSRHLDLLDLHRLCALANGLNGSTPVRYAAARRSRCEMFA